MTEIADVWMKFLNNAAKIINIGGRHRHDNLIRHINSDGSRGGYISTASKVDASAIIPEGSIVLAGATVQRMEVVPDRTLVDKDGYHARKIAALTFK